MSKMHDRYLQNFLESDNLKSIEQGEIFTLGRNS